MGYREFMQRFTPCFYVQQRYILGIMASLGVLVAASTRICLSMTITEMVHKNETFADHADTCPILENDTYIAVKDLEYVYHWNEQIQGNILGSFYWGYIVSHIPGALLAEKWGAKHVVGVGIFICVLLTLLTPVIIVTTNGQWEVLVAIRFIEGIGQGVLFPCMTAIIAQWIPPNERATIGSLVYAGALIGALLSHLMGGLLISATENWFSTFYFFGILGLVWNVLWQLLCYSYPHTHPCLKPQEAQYLEAELTDQVHKDKSKTPWKEILTSPRVWAFVLGEFGHDWGWYMLITDLPKYMNAVLRFNAHDSGMLLALSYLIMFVTTVGSGYVADWLINKKYLTLITTRRTFSIIGQIGPALFMMFASYCGCARMAAVAMFTISLSLMGLFYPGMKVNALDLSPNFAGTIMAISNGLGVIGGMVAPIVVGHLAPNQTLSEWRLVFWISFIFLTGGTIIFVVGLSGDIQSWNNPKQEEQSKEN